MSIVAAAVGDVDGDGRNEVVVAYRSAFHPTRVNELVPAPAMGRPTAVWRRTSACGAPEISPGLDRRHRAPAGRGARRLRLGARRLLLDVAEPEDRRHRRVAMDRVRIRILIGSHRAGPARVRRRRSGWIARRRHPRPVPLGERWKGFVMKARICILVVVFAMVLTACTGKSSSTGTSPPPTSASPTARERRAGLALRVRNASGRAAARRHPRVRRAGDAAQPERRPDPEVTAAAADADGASAAHAERVRDRAERHEADVRRVHGGAVRQLPGLRHDRRRVPPVAPHVRQAPAEHRAAGVAAEARGT